MSVKTSTEEEHPMTGYQPLQPSESAGVSPLPCNTHVLFLVLAVFTFGLVYWVSELIIQFVHPDFPQVQVKNLTSSTINIFNDTDINSTNYLITGSWVADVSVRNINKWSVIQFEAISYQLDYRDQFELSRIQLTYSDLDKSGEFEMHMTFMSVARAMENNSAAMTLQQELNNGQVNFSIYVNAKLVYNTWLLKKADRFSSFCSPIPLSIDKTDGKGALLENFRPVPCEVSNEASLFDDHTFDH